MMEEQEKGLNQEQQNDLAQLQAMAATGDAAMETATITEENPIEAVNLSDEISGLLFMLVNMGAPIFPSLKMIYTPEVVASVGQAVEPVCKKHGWMADGVGGKYKEEMLAMAIIAPLGFATWHGIKADIEARKKDSSNVPKVADGEVIGTKNVIIGSVAQ